MPVGFEAFDINGKIQFTTDAEFYSVVSSGSVALTNVGNSYGQADITIGAGDLVAFRSATGYNLTGFRRATFYRIISQHLTATIDYKILRPWSAASNTDTMGLQLFSASGQLTYSALQASAYIYDAVSVYGSNGIGDLGATLNTPSITNPYALVLGNEFVNYVGESGMDNVERTVCVTTYANSIALTTARQDEWPGMPSGGGVEYAGTYTVAVVY